jgi:hypothetical protein
MGRQACCWHVARGREGHAPGQYTYGFVFVHAIIATADRTIELVCTRPVGQLCRAIHTCVSRVRIGRDPAKTRSKTGDVIRRSSQIAWFSRITTSTWVTWIWPDLRLRLGRRLQQRCSIGSLDTLSDGTVDPGLLVSEPRGSTNCSSHRGGNPLPTCLAVCNSCLVLAEGADVVALLARLRVAELLEHLRGDPHSPCFRHSLRRRQSMSFDLGAHVDSDGGFSDPHTPRCDFDIGKSVNVPSLEDGPPLKSS